MKKYSKLWILVVVAAAVAVAVALVASVTYICVVIFIFLKWLSNVRERVDILDPFSVENSYILEPLGINL